MFNYIIFQGRVTCQNQKLYRPSWSVPRAEVKYLTVQSVLCERYGKIDTIFHPVAKIFVWWPDFHE